MEFFLYESSEMIRVGFTAKHACYKINSVYRARLPITKIINAMICGKRDEGHPELRVNND